MASRIRGITVEISGDTATLLKVLQSIEHNIKNTQTQLKDVEKLLKLDSTNTELLSQKKLFADAVAATKDKLETFKPAAEQAGSPCQWRHYCAQTRLIEKGKQSFYSERTKTRMQSHFSIDWLSSMEYAAS